MKTWIRRTLYGLFGATLLVGGLAACSHHRHHWGAWGDASESERAEMRGRFVERAASRLDLDTAQKAKLAALAEALAAERGKVFGAVHPGSELRSLIAGEKFDRSGAQAWIDARSGALREASPKIVAATADFYDSLKPEQQAKLREALAKGRRHGWHG